MYSLIIGLLNYIIACDIKITNIKWIGFSSQRAEIVHVIIQLLHLKTLLNLESYSAEFHRVIFKYNAMIPKDELKS